MKYKIEVSPYIQSLYEKYLESVYEYSQKEFDQKVKPYLDKDHLNFWVCNGDYTIDYTDRTPRNFLVGKIEDARLKTIDINKVSKIVYETLCQPIPMGNIYHELGLFCNEYKGE